MGVQDYDINPGNNTTISGIAITGSSSVKNGDNALRQLMADTASGIRDSSYMSSGYITKAAGYTVVANCRGKIIDCTAALTLSLTAAATLGEGFMFIVKANGGAVTVDPSGTENINGASASLIIPDGAFSVIACTGTSWHSLVSGTMMSPILTTPKINDATGDHKYTITPSELAADRTVTLPLLAANDEFAFRDHPQTLDKKTLTNPSGLLLQGHLHGLTLSNNVADAINDIDIAGGSAASDGAVPALMALAAGLTKQLDAAWAPGNAGMRDTGSIADGTWHIFVIQRVDTGNVDILASLSPTAPTMPANYTRKRRIGSIIRASGSILQFVQRGDDFSLATPVLDVDVSNQGATSLSRTITVPSGLAVEAKIRVVGQNAVGWSMIIASVYEADLAPNVATSPLTTVFGGGSVVNTATVSVQTDTVSRIRSRASVASTVLRIVTYGWVDTRGRI